MLKIPGKALFVMIVIAAAAVVFFALHSIETTNQSQINVATVSPENKPEETTATEPENKVESTQKETVPAEKTAPIPPDKFILEIPFYSQAPLSNWDAVHEEMCEEASILNAGLFLEGKKLSNQQFDQELANIKNIEIKLFSDYKSTTVAQVKQFSDSYFKGAVSSKVIDNPTIEEIEAEIAAGHPVVVPLAGREIGNPNFKPPGPLYHMLVVKGYDAQNFITNDVGTRKGNSYNYKKSLIMDKMHDWNENDIHKGAKRILILFK